MPVNQGLYAGKTAAEQKKKNEVSAEEFAAALNGNELNEYSKLANYVFKSDNLKEQLSKNMEGNSSSKQQKKNFMNG